MGWWGKHVTKPSRKIRKKVRINPVLSGAEHLAHQWNVINDDDYAKIKKYEMETVDIASDVAMVVAGTMIGGPVGAGMVIGSLSGTSMGLMNGMSLSDAARAGTIGGLGGAVGGGLGTWVGGTTAKLASGLPGNMSTGLGSAMSSGITSGMATGTGAKAAGFSGSEALKIGLMGGIGGGMAGGLGGGGFAVGSGALGMSYQQGQQILQDKQTEGGGSMGGRGGGKTTTASTGTARKSPTSPDAEFLDVGARSWGNSGIGGTFGGLSKIKNKDRYFNTGDIVKLYSQRKAGEFVRR